MSKLQIVELSLIDIDPAPIPIDMAWAYVDESGHAVPSVYIKPDGRYRPGAMHRWRLRCLKTIGRFETTVKVRNV